MPSAAVEKQLAAFHALKTDLFHKDFLLTWEHSTDEIKAILTLAEALKLLHQEGVSYRAFDIGPRHLDLPRQLHPHPLLLRLRRERARLHAVRPGRGEEPDRPRRDRARDRQHDQLPDGGHRHPRRHVPGRGQQVHARGRRRPHRRHAAGRAAPPAQHRQPPVRHRPPDPVAGRPRLAEEALRRPREPEAARSSP